MTQPGSVLIQALPYLYQSESFSDVIFKCKDGLELRSHRAIIGCVSPFLNRIFKEQLSGELVEIVLPDIMSEDLDNLLRFCYEGLIRLEQQETEEFKALVNMFEIKIPMTISMVTTDEEFTLEKADEELNDGIDYETVQSNLSNVLPMCSCYCQLHSSARKFKCKDVGIETDVIREDSTSVFQRGQKRSLSKSPEISSKRLRTAGNPSIAQELNSIIRSYVPKLNVTLHKATSPDRNILHNKRSSGGEKRLSVLPPRGIPLNLFPEFVRRVVTKRIKEENKDIIETEVEKRLAERLEGGKPCLQVQNSELTFHTLILGEAMSSKGSAKRHIGDMRTESGEPSRTNGGGLDGTEDGQKSYELNEKEDLMRSHKENKKKVLEKNKFDGKKEENQRGSEKRGKSYTLYLRS